VRKPGRGELRQAEAAFRSVAQLGRAEGHLNLARVFIREGRLNEAATELTEAAAKGAYPWSVAWFSALVDVQNGQLDPAIDALKALVQTRFTEARRRGFDFSRDYRVLNTLARALFERAKVESSAALATEWLRSAADQHQAALRLDPENVTAHYGLALIHSRLGDRKWPCITAACTRYIGETITPRIAPLPWLAVTMPPPTTLRSQW
jgi:tetratricopeptide (TPR) repeat protein